MRLWDQLASVYRKFSLFSLTHVTGAEVYNYAKFIYYM